MKTKPIFEKYLSVPLDSCNLGELCDLLAKTNISIYYFENRKWWGRKDRSAQAADINEWDELSRKWNEQRNKLKNRIDVLLQNKVGNKPADLHPVKASFPYQILPISLLIDMLTIENIKIYDHIQKGDEENGKPAEAKRKELIKTINGALEEITTNGSYRFEQEARTF